MRDALALWCSGIRSFCLSVLCLTLAVLFGGDLLFSVVQIVRVVRIVVVLSVGSVIVRSSGFLFSFSSELFLSLSSESLSCAHLVLAHEVGQVFKQFRFHSVKLKFSNFAIISELQQILEQRSLDFNC